MKKIFSLLFVLMFSFVTVNASDIEDTSIIDALNKQNIKNLDFDFNLKSFESCEWVEKVMWKYIKNYWKKNRNIWNFYDFNIGINRTETMMDSEVLSFNQSDTSQKVSWIKWSNSLDYSKTNNQVDGVDESDIVKTDWKHIFYYNDADKYVYIVTVDGLNIMKKIKLPSNFYNPILYIGENRLTIVSSGYSSIDYSKVGYWINRNAKTYTMVFDTTDIKSPILSKLYIADWELRKSRKIGDYIYLISNNSFSIPYYTFKTEDDIEVDIKSIMPTKIDITKTDNKEEQNLTLRGKKYPYNIKGWSVAKCNEIEYVLPDDETMDKFSFNPSYNIISVINIRDFSDEVKTKVIAGSNSEIYMSLDNLYLTSNVYQSYDFKCVGGFNCIMPYYSRWNNTVIHKMNIDWSDISYQWSAMVPWSPLTQYSMDEYKWDFRILTSTNNWGQVREQHTDLYILDKNLDLKWSLKNLWDGEDFKSSRYIWDKLFLVTFEQIDPFFVIDVADSANPKVLWELKMPWYSTYLHPYDENHIIGLWYDTVENNWGGITNWGIKVDLYEINYDKKCGDSNLTVTEKEKCKSWDYKGIIVKQKYSESFWDSGSYSEALNNPRMFMWKKSENKLFLPVTLYTKDKEEKYRNIDFFQWLLSLSIDKDSWIKELFRMTHIDSSSIENKRQKECSKYTKENTEKKCVKLIGGWEYCEAVKYRYVPKYCYADSTVGEYMASVNWNYKNSFIKRALWVWKDLFSISNDLIRSSNIDTGIKIDDIELYK